MSKAKNVVLYIVSAPFVVFLLLIFYLSCLSFMEKLRSTGPLGSHFEDKEVYEKVAYQVEESTGDTAVIILDSEASRRRLREIYWENWEFKTIEFYILEKNIGLEYFPKTASRKIFWGEITRGDSGEYVVSRFHPSVRQYLAKKLAAAISSKGEELLGLWQTQDVIYAIIKSRSGDLRKESINARGRSYRIERHASDLKACTSNTCGNIEIKGVSYPNLAKEYISVKAN